MQLATGVPHSLLRQVKTWRVRETSMQDFITQAIRERLKRSHLD